MALVCRVVTGQATSLMFERMIGTTGNMRLGRWANTLGYTSHTYIKGREDQLKRKISEGWDQPRWHGMSWKVVIYASLVTTRGITEWIRSDVFSGRNSTYVWCNSSYEERQGSGTGPDGI